MVNKRYCMSAYLMYRSLLSNEFSFSDKYPPQISDENFVRATVRSSDELGTHLYNEIDKATRDGKAALMLSSGMDSAILARYMPKESKSYTFRCVVPGKSVTDETSGADYFAKMNNIQNEVIEVFWDDFEEYAPLLMKKKGAPIHSIEVQIYKAAKKAKEAGYTKLIFGENADIIYGGMDGLLSKDWSIGEFIDRYSYILPYKVLKDPDMFLSPFQKYTIDGKTDAYAFTNEFFRREALGTYQNACEAAGIEFVGPFSTTKMGVPIDYQRIRSGESKYLIRELFTKLYPGIILPKKIPMPRPMNEWLNLWNGPKREEFYTNCGIGLSGDQKWMLWSLEEMLNIVDEVENNG